MTCIHTLDHIQCLRSAHFPYNNSVGTHSKTGFDQVSECHTADSLCIRLTHLHPNQIGYVMELKLCRILNRDHSFRLRNIICQHI